MEAGSLQDHLWAACLYLELWQCMESCDCISPWAAKTFVIQPSTG